MKKITPYLLVVLTFILVLLVNCQKEEFDLQNQNNSTINQKQRVIKTLNAVDIPNIINHINSNTKNAFLNTKSHANYGNLDLDDILQVIDTIGNINYSFSITNVNDDGLSIYNLIVHTDENQNANTPYIIQYKMTEDFAIAYYSGDKTFGEFTGKAYKYTLNSFLDNYNSALTKNDSNIITCVCDETDIVDGNTNTSTGSGPTSDDDGSNSGGGSTSDCSLRLILQSNPCDGGGIPSEIDTNEHEPTDLLSDGVVTSVCSGSPGDTYVMQEVCDSAIHNKSETTTAECDENGCPIDGDGDIGVNIDKIVVDYLSFRLYPCQKDIVVSVYKNKDALATAVISAFKDKGADKSKVNLTYKVEDLINPSPTAIINGKTEPISIDSDGVSNIDVILDTQAAEEGSDLLIAVTMIHENVHALLLYIDAVVNLDNVDSNSSLGELAEAYTKWKADPNNIPSNPAQTQHFYMTQLVDQMSVALKDFGESKGYVIDDEYYEHLCWTSDMAQFAPDNIKSEINSAFQNERLLAGVVDANGNPTYTKGNKCPPN